jgi:hypothetical protein
MRNQCTSAGDVKGSRADGGGSVCVIVSVCMSDRGQLDILRTRFSGRVTGIVPRPVAGAPPNRDPRRGHCSAER